VGCAKRCDLSNVTPTYFAWQGFIRANKKAAYSAAHPSDIIFELLIFPTNIAGVMPSVMFAPFFVPFIMVPIPVSVMLRLHVSVIVIILCGSRHDPNTHQDACNCKQ
jgi:hypothetical protein